jgi:hypothetical protein
MEALIPVVALVTLGLLALRPGTRSRLTRTSNELRLARPGMMREPAAGNASPVVTDPATTEVQADLGVSHLVWTPVPAGAPASPYPTLLALDRAREPGHAAFATGPDAAFLEQRARHLIDRHWSERVWMTGFVDRARFDRLCDTLEHDRQVLQQQRLDVVVDADHPSSIAS